MNTPGTPRDTKPTIAQAQIIVLALIMGIVLFAVVAYVVSPLDGPSEGIDAAEPAIPMFPLILAVQGTMAIAAAFFLRGVLAQRVKPRREEARGEVREGVMPAELLTATIVSAALVESLGLLGCVGYLLDAQMAYLAAPVVAVALMAFWLPSKSSVENWLEGLS